MRRFWKKDTVKERRRVKRLKEENDITAIIISGEGNYPKGEIINNKLKDISVLGAKIQANVFFPVKTLLEMNITFKDLYYNITTLGEVKWIRKVIGEESYEAGVEFISSPLDSIQKLSDYISWKLNQQIPDSV
ncbi:MAG: PilZ domain-containing protein [Syntrophaceae bacterium]|nr:PilZ domain-containing protein [Syntrophaceae bacterium]